MFLLISVEGAPGLRSIAWSHGHGGGNFFDSWSLKTHLYCWYWRGIFPSSFSWFTSRCCVMIHARTWLANLGVNCAFAASGEWSTMGS
jgi:hypothetical protein